ncbi:MAG: hypothetical protein JWN77_229 [Frankiales bacterium]|nr:hypothetical protein [Frankiales bacterium]
MTRRPVLSALVDDALVVVEPPEREAAETLLADLFACVFGAGAGNSPHGWQNDGTAGLAAALAMRAHARDQDDLHWTTGVHPGSVVWPVVLAVGAEVEATGDEALRAALAGYNAMTGLALQLGTDHARTWHATATCGALGASVSAAMLLRLTADQIHEAAAHAVAMAGGVGQALLERSGTTLFHRIAAAGTGVQAARLAASGVSGSHDPILGERGVVALLAPRARVRYEPGRVPDALATSSVRVFPVNGFAQGAVALAAQLGREAGPEVDDLAVEVAPAVADAITGAVGGDWWDVRSAVAAAWTSGDPFLLEPSDRSAELRARVRVVPRAGCATTATRLVAATPHGTRYAELATPPGARLDDPELRPLLARKWDRLVGPQQGGAAFARSLAQTALSAGPGRIHLREDLANSGD